MRYLTPRQWLSVLLVVFSIAYPLLVYHFWNRVSPSYFVGGILSLLLIRAVLSAFRQKNLLNSVYFSLIMIVVMLGLYIWNRDITPFLYPVIMSLAVAFLMGLSLLYPPSLIERFARVLEPDLDQFGIVYTRKVTVVWMLFGIVNAAISLVTVVMGNPAVWALYNGCVSYVLMGLLMGVEYIVRRYCRAKQARIAQGLR